MQQKAPLFIQAKKAETLYYVAKGSVAVLIKDQDGHEMILSYLNQGDFIGEVGLFDESENPKRTAWVKAKTSLKWLKFHIAVQTASSGKTWRFLMRLTAQISRRLSATSAKVGNLAFLDVTGRIAKTLVNLAHQPEAMTHPDGMQIKITRQEIGQIVGCSRETVGRILKMMEEDHLITAHGKTIVVFGTR